MSPLGLFRQDFCFGVGEAHASCWCARRPPSRGNQLLSVSALPNPCHTAHGWGPHPSPRFPLITRTWASLCLHLSGFFTRLPNLALLSFPTCRHDCPQGPPRSSRTALCPASIGPPAFPPRGLRTGPGLPRPSRRRPHPSPSSCLSRVWRPLSCLSPRVSPLCARSQPDPPYLSRTFTLITSSRSYK